MNMSSLEMDVENNDFLSILAYSATFDSATLYKNELDELCLLLYKNIKTLQLDKCIEIIKDIRSNKTQQYFTYKNYKIRIRDKSTVELIFLMSLMHFNGEKLFFKHVENIIHMIIQSDINNVHFIHILKGFLNILKRNKRNLSKDVAFNLLLFAQKIYTFPLKGFKSYSCSISTFALSLCDTEHIKTYFTHLELLPIAGIDTSKLVSYFETKVTNEYVKEIVFKVLDMFSNNIENREGSFLYQYLLQAHGKWDDIVLSYFIDQFRDIDLESEFFQSIIKYWIPINIEFYKDQALYELICNNKAIPRIIKGTVLFQMTRKGFCPNDGYIELLYPEECSRYLAFKILLTKSAQSSHKYYPTMKEINFIGCYVVSQNELDSSDINLLLTFFHNNIERCQERNEHDRATIDSFQMFFETMMSFCINEVHSENRQYGVQLYEMFQKLKSMLKNDLFVDYINKAFPTDLFIHYLVDSVSKLDNKYLLQFIDCRSCFVSVNTSKNVIELARKVISNNDNSENLHLGHQLYTSIKYLMNKGFIADLRYTFRVVLLFDALLVLIQKQEIRKSLNTLYSLYLHEFEHLCLSDVEIVFEAASDVERHPMMKKVVEALLNNIISFIEITYRIFDKLEYLDPSKVIAFLTKIIQISNLRRPTTLSADVLILVLSTLKKNEDNNKILFNGKHLKNVNMLFLDDILFKIFYASSTQSLSIRKNPESRLILHALCVSDDSSGRVILNWILNELLKILSTTSCNKAALSSALNTIETIMLDNTLYGPTLKYVPDIILACIELFKNNSWIIRNAVMQLTSALINRFYGILMDDNKRPKSIEDFLSFFPNLIVPFFRTMAQEPLNESFIVVAMFFSESQLKKKPFSSVFLTDIRPAFLSLLTKIIKYSCNHYSTFAVGAYISLCLESDIPLIIQDIVEFMTLNVSVIKTKHTISNFLLLLKGLYNKYIKYVNKLAANPFGINIIQKSFQQLLLGLNNFNCTQFDLLQVKVLSADTALLKFYFVSINNGNWEDRVWQNNYLPYIIKHCSDNDLYHAINTILSRNISDCIQVKVLNHLIDRYCKDKMAGANWKDILYFLINQIFDIHDKKNYLIMCYFKVIHFMLANKGIELNGTICNKFRECYENFKNIYKIFTVIILLNRMSLTFSDKRFIKASIKLISRLDIDNIDTAKTISDILPYFYQLASCHCEKVLLFKIGVYLILEYELLDFAACITGSMATTPLVALIDLFDYQTLKSTFNSAAVALDVVRDFHANIFKKHNTCTSNQYNSYYIDEENMSVIKPFLKKIIVRFLVFYSYSENIVEIIEVLKKKGAVRDSEDQDSCEYSAS